MNKTQQVIFGIVTTFLFLFPLLYIRGFMYPAIFPRTAIAFLVIEAVLLLFLLYGLRQKIFTVPKNGILIGLLVYVVVLFLAGIFGENFTKSFWSGYTRMTGIITTLHYVVLCVVLAATIPKDRWYIIFRSIFFSGLVLALGSFLGNNGLDIGLFSFLDRGGSLLGNNTFSGIYYILIFFFSAIGIALEQRRSWRLIYLSGLVLIFLNPDIFSFDILSGAQSLSEVFRNPTLLLGEARLSTLVLWAGLPILLICYGIHRFVRDQKIKLILIGLIFAAMVAAPFFFIHSAVTEKGIGHQVLISQQDYPRLIVWQQAAEAVHKRPVLGYGPNNFEYAFQDTFNSKVVFLAGNNWFDRPHNTILQTLTDTGIAGSLALLALLVMVIYYSFTFYRRDGRFYLLIIPLIFLVNFWQTQTSFDTNSSLVLLFVLLAFLMVHTRKRVEWRMPQDTELLKYGAAALLIIAFIFSVYLPVRHNRLVVKLATIGYFDARLEIYEQLKHSYIYPADTLRVITENYVGSVFAIIDQIEAEGNQDKVAQEFERIIELHEAHLPRYGDTYRYLINYANVIHIARVFGVDYTARIPKLLADAKEISTQYPQVYWISALDAFYNRDVETALAEAQHAVSLYEDQTFSPGEEAMLDTTVATAPKILQFIELRKDVERSAFYFLSSL